MSPAEHAERGGSPASDVSDVSDERITLGPADATVQVRIAGEVVAESDRATLLLERGCPPRWYLPPDDVRLDLLHRSSTTTVCPFKGEATYWSYEPAGPAGHDVAWSYEDPVTPMAAIRGLICFWTERTDTTVGGTAR